MIIIDPPEKEVEREKEPPKNVSIDIAKVTIAIKGGLQK